MENETDLRSRGRSTSESLIDFVDPIPEEPEFRITADRTDSLTLGHMPISHLHDRIATLRKDDHTPQSESERSDETDEIAKLIDEGYLDRTERESLIYERSSSLSAATEILKQRTRRESLNIKVEEAKRRYLAEHGDEGPRIEDHPALRDRPDIHVCSSDCGHSPVRAPPIDEHLGSWISEANESMSLELSPRAAERQVRFSEMEGEEMQHFQRVAHPISLVESESPRRARLREIQSHDHLGRTNTATAISKAVKKQTSLAPSFGRGLRSIFSGSQRGQNRSENEPKGSRIKNFFSRFSRKKTRAAADSGNFPVEPGTSGGHLANLFNHPVSFEAAGPEIAARQIASGGPPARFVPRARAVQAPPPDTILFSERSLSPTKTGSYGFQRHIEVGESRVVSHSATFERASPGEEGGLQDPGSTGKSRPKVLSTHSRRVTASAFGSPQMAARSRPASFGGNLEGASAATPAPGGSSSTSPSGRVRSSPDPPDAHIEYQDGPAELPGDSSFF